MSNPIDTRYVPFYNLEQYFVDKDTGEPLSSGVVTFYVDTQRSTAKSVYMISGSSPNYTFTDIGNQLTLSSVGTFVDEDGNPIVVYGYPYDANGDPQLYYVTVYSSDDVFQLDVEATPYYIFSSS